VTTTAPSIKCRIFSATRVGTTERPIPEAKLLPSDEGNLWIVEFKGVTDLCTLMAKYVDDPAVLFQPYGVRYSDGSVGPIL
jgi:hypothetical protein